MNNARPQPNATRALAPAVILVPSVLLVSLLVAADAVGLFFYFSYFIPALVLSPLVVMAVAAIRRPGNTRSARLCLAAVVFFLVITVFALPYLPTSPRKRFFATVRSVPIGAPLTEVREHLQGYSFDTTPEFVRFYYRSGPGDQDMAVIGLTPVSQLVSSVTYDPD